MCKMKKFLRKMCMLTLALGFSSSAWAIEEVDGVYQIGSAQDMAEFAQVVNELNANVNAVLTADIDLTEMGDVTIGTKIPFTGTFDGAFHTITINRTAEGEYNALFRQLAGTIKNLNVAGTIVSNAKYAAGMVGQATGNDAKLLNCICTVTIESSVSGDCTSAGFIATNEGKTIVENCAFAGRFVSSTAESWGGFCGWSNGSTTYKNCMMIADVSETNSNGSNVFARNPSKCEFKNCLYLNDFGEIPGGSTKVTAEQLTNGEACFFLNEKQSENCSWFQTLGEDAIPVPNAAHGTVYANGKLHCNGQAYESGVVYSNVNEGTVKDEHNWENGLCDYCHTPDLNYLTAAEDGFYEISTPEHFLWIAAMVNNGIKQDICVRQTAAINMEGYEWPSIGTRANVFNGVFNGQRHAIENLTGPLFGSAQSAKFMNIALESASISGRNSDLANQTGSIVCTAFESEMTGSYSKATLVLGAEGDLGGLAGKFTGTIKDCAFLGSISSADWTEGGIAGSGEGNAITIEDCMVYAELLTTGGEAKGTILGWNDNATIKNCVTIQAPEGFTGLSGRTSKAEENCLMLTPEEFATGAVAWKLNNNTFANPVWFQSLGEDPYPTHNPEQGVVYQPLEGEYTNDMEEMKTTLFEETSDYADNVIAQQSLVDELHDAASLIESAATFEELCTAYTAVQEVLAKVQTSAAAYAEYMKQIEETKAYIEENGATMAGPALVRLESYLYDEIAPEEDNFPNGSFEYIMTNMELTAEQITAEIALLTAMLDEAIRNGYAPGTEITSLIQNANLNATPDFSGWTYNKQGTTLTVLRDETTTYAAEGWNATFDLKQTLTGLSNGVYEIRLNAVYRAANDNYDGNDNYGGYLYANDNFVYVMTAGEDLISMEDAINRENSFLEEGQKNPDMLYDNGIVAGFCPTGPVGCFYAFGAGRYENRIVAEVTDGTLTIGVQNAGTGCDRDWLGFDNFRLFYLGTPEQAADGITPTLEGMVARANTLLAYQADSGEDYRKRPNFSNELRAQLEAAIAATETATTTEEKMEVIAQFSDTFKEIHACKQAYVILEATIESLVAQVFEDPTATEEERTEMQEKSVEAMGKWMDGAYTTEQAITKEGIMQTAYCQRYLQNAPQQIGNTWQLASLQDLQWFAQIVNEMGDVYANAAIVAPIDMSGVSWQPIGKASRPYAGQFDGGLYPLTNINQYLFGNTNSANIKGVAIVGGSIGGNSDYAAHTGSIIGVAGGRTFLTRSYSTAHLYASTGDCGGLIGKVTGSGTIRDCFFAGNLSAGWSAGCMVGSSEGTSIAEISNSYVDASNVTYSNGDAHGLVVGWLHDGLVSNIRNVYVIAAPELTNIMGRTNDAEGAAEACKTLTAEEFASGAVAHKLNNGNEADPTWFQTLGTDACPVLDNSHMIVILNEDGTYSNKQGDAIDKVEMSQKLPAIVNVYDMQGRLVKANVKAGDSLNGLPHGLYIVGGKKMLK